MLCSRYVQTFGDLVKFNPHVHMLAADDAFDANGLFSVLPPIPRKLIESWFKAEVLALPQREGLISETLAARMHAWWHTGFSVHNAVRIRALHLGAPDPPAQSKPVLT